MKVCLDSIVNTRSHRGLQSYIVVKEDLCVNQEKEHFPPYFIASNRNYFQNIL